MRRPTVLLLALCSWSASLFAAVAERFDVVVYGGSSGGVVAAVQAAQMNQRVALVCPDQHLGGLTSGGLGFTDSGHTAVIGGLAKAFYQQVWRQYQEASAWPWQAKSSFGNRGQGTKAMDDETQTMWTFEPHIAEAVFDDWVTSSGVMVWRNEWLDREGGVSIRNGQVSSIRMLSELELRAGMFIDATYEGDLMAAAGVPYRLGREANRDFGETWNGVQTGVLHHRHNFGVPGLEVDPYWVAGDPTSGLLPRISSASPGVKGASDRRIQAYCFRMCLSDHPDNRVPFSRPEFYDPSQYELLARIFEAGWREVFVKFDRIPNRKTDTNNHGPFSTDNIGQNYDYPEASYERRAEIVAEHRRYQQGLMYFLANDQAVPEAIREKMSRMVISGNVCSLTGR